MAVFNIVSNANTVPTMIAKMTVIKAKAFLQLTKLTTMDFNNDIQEHGNIVNVVAFSGISAIDKVAGTPIATIDYQGGTTSTKSIPLEKHLVVPIQIDDTGKLFSKPNALENLTQEAAIKLSEAIETYVWTKVSAHTNVVGTPAAAIDESLIRTIRTKLSKNKAPKFFQKYLIVGVDGYDQIMNVDDFTKASTVGDQNANVMVEGEIRRVFGMWVHENQTAPEPAATEREGVSFITPGFATVTRPLNLETANQLGVRQELVTDEDTGLSLRMSMQYSIRDVGIIMNLDTLIGAGIIKDEWVIKVDHLGVV